MMMMVVHRIPSSSSPKGHHAQKLGHEHGIETHSYLTSGGVVDHATLYDGLFGIVQEREHGPGDAKGFLVRGKFRQLDLPVRGFEGDVIVVYGVICA